MTWNLTSGDYTIGNPKSQVVIVTLGSHLDETRLSKKAALVGACKTENIGLEKIVANVVSNPNIRYLIMCGAEVHGHLAGDALINLHKNGISENGDIIGAKGAIPYFSNISSDVVDRFRDQVDIINLLGVEDLDKIESAIDSCLQKEPYPEDPIVVDFTGGTKKEKEDFALKVLTPDYVSIESRIRMIENEIKDLGKLSKLMSGIISGIIQGFVIGFIIIIVLFAITRLLRLT
ncbi:MAG: tetrahydromethanopterin S-methyltransferase subunit A [Methanosarcinales archaeon]